MKVTNRFFKHLSLIALIGAPLSSLLADEEIVEETVVEPAKFIADMPAASFYLLIVFLIAVIIGASFMIYKISKSLAPLADEVEKKTGKKPSSWFELLNNTQSLDADSEAEIDLGHDYDGIRELDNPTPPWWRWGFRISIAFGFIYMWVYFVGKNAPLQLEELAIANAKAEVAKQAYLAKAGNIIDENNIPLLENLDEIEEGHRNYLTYCVACHTEDGGGAIGPNLTDDYWLHGGKINDIFRTIKYGIQGTGMRDWQNDFSDKQIVQIANFVHTLKGTQPQNPKEPEGELEK